MKPKLRNSFRGIDIEIEIEQFHSVILILKPKSWIPNGDIDIETKTEEYDFHYRTSNGILKTSIAHAWSKEVSVSEFAQSDSPDDFKWSLLGQWIIPKVIPAHALTLKEGPWPEFVVSPIECGGANQLFKIFVLDCDKAN